MNFSTKLTNRNQALNAIALEIRQAFNLVAAGLGDEVDAKARAKFPDTPISFGIDVSEYAPQQRGTAHFTLVWGALEDDRTDPATVYGYFLDFLMDLNGTTVTVEQFNKAVRNRWDLIPKRRMLLEAWKRAKNGNTATEIDVTDTPTSQVALVDPQFPKHRFAQRSEPVIV